MFAVLEHSAAGLGAFRQRWQTLLQDIWTNEPPSRLRRITPSTPDPGNLDMLVYLPPRLRAKAPLVVALHGCAQTADAYDRGTGWSVLAEEHGFAVLFPQQKPANNPYCCFDWFQPHDSERDRGEALSIQRMIRRMLVEHDLDPGQVYITGLSAGGAMSAVMLATYPELFAGGAILAGLPYRSASGPREALGSMADGPSRPAPEWGRLVRAASGHPGPWPRLSVWHGDADTTVSPANADEIVKQWLDLHGLDPRPTLTYPVKGAVRRVWRDARGRDCVELYRVPGLGHAVPILPGAGDGRYGSEGPFMADVGLSSTRHIAEFWGVTRPGWAPWELAAGLTSLFGGLMAGFGRRSGSRA